MTVAAYPVYMFDDVLPIINDNFEENQSSALTKVCYRMEEMFQTYNDKYDTIMTIINDHTIKHNELKTEIKKDLLLELATKADII